jgi:hypothetical protein
MKKKLIIYLYGVPIFIYILYKKNITFYIKLI